MGGLSEPEVDGVETGSTNAGMGGLGEPEVRGVETGSTAVEIEKASAPSLENLFYGFGQKNNQP